MGFPGFSEESAERDRVWRREGGGVNRAGREREKERETDRQTDRGFLLILRIMHVREVCTRLMLCHLAAPNQNRHISYQICMRPNIRAIMR